MEILSNGKTVYTQDDQGKVFSAITGRAVKALEKSDNGLFVVNAETGSRELFIPEYSGGGSEGGGGIDTSDATASSADILNGETAYAKGEKVTGKIQSKGAQSFTPGTSDQTIKAGVYLSGAQTIKGDSDLIASNIKSGVTIFNVSGSFTSDATAAASDIAKDKTAYVNGVKVTGTASGGGGETFYKCTEVFGPSDITFLTVTGAGSDCNGRYDDTGNTKNGQPVYQFTNASGQKWYIYYFSSEWDGNCWLLCDNVNVDYPYSAHYFAQSITSNWQNGDYGEGNAPTVTMDNETINADQPKTWNGKKAEFDGTKFLFSSEVTTNLRYSARKPVTGGVYTDDIIISADYIYTGFPEISCPVNPDSNTFGPWFISASSTYDPARAPYKAFTEGVTNEGSDGWHSSNEAQAWLSWENTREPVLISRYSVLFRSDAGATKFALQGSNNGSDWVTLDTVDNPDKLAQVDRVINNDQAFTHHRILILQKFWDYIMIYRVTARSV